jgi:predicted unusual protein kinase regulating ubiquinone biosynthesis (AarF/ABC1/UbiB family)
LYVENAQVLTMEYVPGIKINRIAALDELGVDRQKLARYAVESYLEQILRHGFFHADPVCISSFLHSFLSFPPCKSNLSF